MMNGAGVVRAAMTQNSPLGGKEGSGAVPLNGQGQIAFSGPP